MDVTQQQFELVRFSAGYPAHPRTSQRSWLAIMTSNKGYGLTQEFRDDIRSTRKSIQDMGKSIQDMIQLVKGLKLESSFGTSASDVDPSADVCCDTSVTTNSDGQCWEGVDPPTSISENCTPQINADFGLVATGFSEGVVPSFSKLEMYGFSTSNANAAGVKP